MLFGQGTKAIYSRYATEQEMKQYEKQITMALNSLDNKIGVKYKYKIQYATGQSLKKKYIVYVGGIL